MVAPVWTASTATRVIVSPGSLEASVKSVRVCGTFSRSRRKALLYHIRYSIFSLYSFHSLCPLCFVYLPVCLSLVSVSIIHVGFDRTNTCLHTGLHLNYYQYMTPSGVDWLWFKRERGGERERQIDRQTETERQRETDTHRDTERQETLITKLCSFESLHYISSLHHQPSQLESPPNCLTAPYWKISTVFWKPHRTGIRTSKLKTGWHKTNFN